ARVEAQHWAGPAFPVAGDFLHPPRSRLLSDTAPERLGRRVIPGHRYLPAPRVTTKYRQRRARADASPAVLAENKELGAAMSERQLWRGPSVYQNKAGEAIVGADQQRDAPIRLPIAFETPVGEASLFIDLAMRAAHRRELGEVVQIELQQAIEHRPLR